MSLRHPAPASRPRAAGALLAGALAGALVVVGFPPAQAGGDHRTTDAVLHWNDTAGRAAVAACIAPVDNPLIESRMYAMTHLAVHDALNAIDRRSEPYAADFHTASGASVDAAVAAAARDVLVAVLGRLPEPFARRCEDQGLAVVEAAYADALADVPDGWRQDAGVRAGQRGARAVLALRADDGSTTPLIAADHPQGTAPGEWRFTPDRPFAFAPGWAEVTPFALRSSHQFRSAPPHPLTSAAYARDLREIAALGGDDLTTPSRRTPAQTETALFWLESSPLAWNRIARTVAASQPLDAWEQARLFGLLNLALADGYIGSWARKYEHPTWRPVTAIRLADTDGNPRTSADPTWTPLVTTPPIPEHDSAHAVEGGAAAMVLRRFLGTDRMHFAACSNTLPAGGCGSADPTLHHFTRFSQAAEENSVSRVYVGFHFRWASEQGQRHGERIGSHVVDTQLRPVR